MAIKQSIPDVGMDLDSHTRVLKSIKEAIELGQGAKGDQLDSFVTMERMVELGLLNTINASFVQKKQNFRDLILNSPWAYYNVAVPSSTPHQKPGYYKDALGRVFLRGLIASGTSATNIATLPADFRPEASTMFNVRGSVSSTEASYRIDVNANGTVTVFGAGTFDYLSLDMISFAAYQ